MRHALSHLREGPRRTLGLLVMTVTATACASVTAHEPPSSGRSTTGSVSFEQVRDPRAKPPHADGRFEYLRPRLEEGFGLPNYPESALAAAVPPVEILVRVVVAEDGSVASVGPSPLAAPARDEWEVLFLEAVEEAVAGWRYDPCQLRELEDGPDRDGDGAPDFQVVLASTPLAVYLDLAFRFEIVDGDGRVSPVGGGS